MKKEIKDKLTAIKVAQKDYEEKLKNLHKQCNELKDVWKNAINSPLFHNENIFHQMHSGTGFELCGDNVTYKDGLTLQRKLPTDFKDFGKPAYFSPYTAQCFRDKFPIILDEVWKRILAAIERFDKPTS